MFKMALSKVDLSSKLLYFKTLLDFKTQYFQLVISFLTERHKRQTEIVLKMLTVDSNKKRNTKKKERELLRYWVRPGRNNIWWTNILNNTATLEEWREKFCMS